MANNSARVVRTGAHSLIQQKTATDNKSPSPYLPKVGISLYLFAASMEFSFCQYPVYLLSCMDSKCATPFGWTNPSENPIKFCCASLISILYAGPMLLQSMEQFRRLAAVLVSARESRATIPSVIDSGVCEKLEIYYGPSTQRPSMTCAYDAHRVRFEKPPKSHTLGLSSDLEISQLAQLQRKDAEGGKQARPD